MKLRRNHFLRNMPDKYKEPWVQALRSGNYKQTEGALCDSRGYCCLGVLLDACAPECWTPREADSSGDKGVSMGPREDCSNAEFGDGISYGELTSDLLEKFGLHAGEAETLMALNDNDALSFHQIADRVEAGDSGYDSSPE